MRVGQPRTVIADYRPTAILSSPAQIRIPNGAGMGVELWMIAADIDVVFPSEVWG